jgi:hypothetical protein
MDCKKARPEIEKGAKKAEAQNRKRCEKAKAQYTNGPILR